MVANSKFKTRPDFGTRTSGRLEDIQMMVNQFYSRVKADPVIGPVFLRKISNETGLTT